MNYKKQVGVNEDSKVSVSRKGDIISAREGVIFSIDRVYVTIIEHDLADLTVRQLSSLGLNCYRHTY